MSAGLWLAVVAATVLVLWYYVQRATWSQKWQARWALLKADGATAKWAQRYNSPEGVLGRARKELAMLRKGCEHQYGVNLCLGTINEALGIGWSYEDIGADRQEIIGFRNGESQKIAARKLLACLREDDVAGKISLGFLRERIEDLSRDQAAGFPLAEIGTTSDELEEMSRRDVWRRRLARRKEEAGLRKKGDRR